MRNAGVDVDLLCEMDDDDDETVMMRMRGMVGLLSLRPHLRRLRLLRPDSGNGCT